MFYDGSQDSGYEAPGDATIGGLRQALESPCVVISSAIAALDEGAGWDLRRNRSRSDYVSDLVRVLNRAIAGPSDKYTEFAAAPLSDVLDSLAKSFPAIKDFECDCTEVGVCHHLLDRYKAYTGDGRLQDYTYRQLGEPPAFDIRDIDGSLRASRLFRKQNPLVDKLGKKNQLFFPASDSTALKFTSHLGVLQEPLGEVKQQLGRICVIGNGVVGDTSDYFFENVVDYIDPRFNGRSMFDLATSSLDHFDTVVCDAAKSGDDNLGMDKWPGLMSTMQYLMRNGKRVIYKCHFTENLFPVVGKSRSHNAEVVCDSGHPREKAYLTRDEVVARIAGANTMRNSVHKGTLNVNADYDKDQFADFIDACEAASVRGPLQRQVEAASQAFTPSRYVSDTSVRNSYVLDAEALMGKIFTKASTRARSIPGVLNRYWDMLMDMPHRDVDYKTIADQGLIPHSDEEFLNLTSARAYCVFRIIANHCVQTDPDTAASIYMKVMDDLDKQTKLDTNARPVPPPNYDYEIDQEGDLEDNDPYVTVTGDDEDNE